MGAASAIFGAIGGLCAVLGIVTAGKVVEPIAPEFTWIFWFSLAAILLLASIALALGRSGE